MSTRLLFLALALALAPLLAIGQSACGPSNRQVVERARLRTTVEDLEASAREDRRKMRDLQYEVARLMSKLKPIAKAARQDDELADDVPTLPVEVLTPDGGELPEDTLASADDESFELFGDGEDGVEIVYVGDAARDHSVKPDTGYLRPRPPRPTTHAAKQQPASHRRRARSRPIALPDSSGADHIEVTDAIGPTVARQLAQAEERSATARNPSPVSAPHKTAPPAEKPLFARPVSKPELEADPRAEYARYYQALRAGNHGFAITGLGHFIERHPDHPYADNARYWLAEAHYDLRAYRTALDEFRKVERDYPSGNKVPDSLLKIAYCHIALGERGEARTLMARLIERFPRSNPAQLARERLATLDGE